MADFIPKLVTEESWVKLDPNKDYGVVCKPEGTVFVRLGAMGALYLAISFSEKKEWILETLDFETGVPTLAGKLIPGKVTGVGRAGDDQIKIKHAIVSRKHLDIFVTDELVVIKDLGSTNGTNLAKDIPHFVVDEYDAKKDAFQQEFGPKLDDAVTKFVELKKK